MNIAFIPVRGGSKSIPLKNIKEICGKPLVYWTVAAANACENIDKVIVSTDSPIIESTVVSFGFPKVEIHHRSAESATDTASTEFAMLEYARQAEFDNMVLVQATSPLLSSEDLSHGFEVFNQPDCDSVLSVVKQKRFYWDIAEDTGNAIPVNYDPFHRPRRQEFEGFLTENGAFYITSRDDLLSSGNRISGNIRSVEMDEATAYEIDEPSDWIIIEKLMQKRIQTEAASQLPDFSHIKMFLTDSDGCLTDGGMYYTENGDEIKKFNTQDGKGLALLKEANIITGIVTGESRELVSRRAQKLGVDILEMGANDKLPIIRKLCEQYDISLEDVCYIGDDLGDLDVIKAVGIGCSVPNGIDIVKKSAKYITKKSGGNGAIREVADLILATKV
ncbi:MAG: N-acylneuraminate cytidylyltransferase [Lachnospiraceae bacterium]|nr:N-acylneuraminate cytidylyltransferase [Lachnospiraceae bacterium]